MAFSRPLPFPPLESPQESRSVFQRPSVRVPFLFPLPVVALAECQLRLPLAEVPVELRELLFRLYPKNLSSPFLILTMTILHALVTLPVLVGLRVSIPPLLVLACRW